MGLMTDSLIDNFRKYEDEGYGIEILFVVSSSDSAFTHPGL